MRISPIKEVIKKRYDIEAKSVDLVSTEYDENIEVITYVFSYNHKEYIGDCYIKNSKENENISTENIIYINFQTMKDKETPFTTIASAGVKKESQVNNEVRYHHYYGYINDERITEIVIKFGDNITHIKPISRKYYSILKYSNSNRPKLDYIKGLNNKKQIVYNYNFN